MNCLVWDHINFNLLIFNIDRLPNILLRAFAIGLKGSLAPGLTLLSVISTSLESGMDNKPKVSHGHAPIEGAIFCFLTKQRDLLFFPARISA
jgi:hypothetical protein